MCGMCEVRALPRKEHTIGVITEKKIMNIHLPLCVSVYMGLLLPAGT